MRFCSSLRVLVTKQGQKTVARQSQMPTKAMMLESGLGLMIFDVLRNKRLRQRVRYSFKLLDFATYQDGMSDSVQFRVSSQFPPSIPGNWTGTTNWIIALVLADPWGRR
jgi:hypothetical protein